jgi:ATP-binding cassette subfamily B protein
MRGVLAEETTKPKSVGATLARFGSYFKPHWPQLLLVVVMMFAGTWAQVTAPDLIGQLVDCYLTPAVTSQFTSGASIPGMPSAGTSAQTTSNCRYPEALQLTTNAERITGLGKMILMIVGLYILSALTGGLQFYLMSYAGQHVLRRIRTEVFDHILRLSIGYHVEHEAGDTMSRITNDADTVQQAVSFTLVQVLSGVLLIVWIAYSMLTRSVAYALVAMSVMPLMIIATSYFSNQARRAFRRTRTSIGSVNADLQESIAGVREVQAFSREQEHIDAFREVNAANRDANIRAVSFTAALAPTLEALGYVALMLVTAVGGLAILRGQDFFGTTISFGLMVTFLGYVQRFNQPIQQISVMWTNIQSAIAGGERIFGLIDVVPDVQDLPDAKPMPPIVGRVEFQNVWAEYTPGEPVLKGINLRAEPGQMIAIAGPTGAGKTTMANIIPRFYDVTQGRVLIDGQDVRELNATSLRSQIGMVLQDSFLFNDSILEIIRFGRPEATDEEVIAAARLAHADTFIERLPEGYQTVLGERGTGLSQGQRQLISIARAALADPRLLILDEATSSVDTRTERLIQAALEKLLSGRTSFVIAHRLSTIRNADQVLVIDDGRIVEQGKHDELLARKGFYYNLYMRQFRRREAESPKGGDGRGAPARAGGMNHKDVWRSGVGAHGRAPLRVDQEEQVELAGGFPGLVLSDSCPR